MAREPKIYPPLSVVNTRLTVIAREQKRLNTLRSLIVQAQQDAEQFGSMPTPSLPGDKPTGRRP